MALSWPDNSETGELLGTLVSASPVGLALADIHLRYRLANDAFAAFAGAPLDQILGRTIPEKARAVWKQLEPLVRRAIDLGQATYDFMPLQDAEAPTKWCASFFPLRVGGQIVGIGISVFDAKSLGGIPALFPGQSEQVAEIQYTLDIDRHHPPSPDRVLDLLGIQRADFAADDDMFVNAVYPPDDEHAVDLGLEYQDCDNSVALEHRLVRADGTERWIHESAEVQVSDGGQQTLVGTVQHITEHNEAETRLHQMQAELLHVSRLSAMGQVSSTLAHEVNQPLTAVGNYIRAGLMLMESHDPASRAKVRSVFEKAAQQAARASDIVRNLREFLRKGDSIRRPENLTIVVQEAMALARLGARDRGLRVRLKLDGNSSLASVNRIQIQQVLVNLIRNAIEAMVEGRREIVVATRPGDAGFIEVSVADTGPGLNENIARGLFKPFMTTKAEGMGVGLAICQSIIEAHGGKIWAEPNYPGGTIFRFTVPRDEAGTISKPYPR